MQRNGANGPCLNEGGSRPLKKRLTQLGDQLDAIQRALDVALREPDPARRDEWLRAVDQAATAAAETHQAVTDEAAQRPALRIIKGGSAGAAVVAAGTWVREHPVRTGTGTVMALAAATALWAGVPSDGPRPEVALPPTPPHSIPAQPQPTLPDIPSQPHTSSDGGATRVHDDRPRAAAHTRQEPPAPAPTSPGPVAPAADQPTPGKDPEDDGQEPGAPVDPPGPDVPPGDDTDDDVLPEDDPPQGPCLGIEVLPVDLALCLPRLS